MMETTEDGIPSSGEVAAAIASSQERHENPKTVKERARIAEVFEDYKGARELSIGVFDGFLLQYEHKVTKEGTPKKASTMWTVRSHLIEYIHMKYGVDFSKDGSYTKLLAVKSKEQKPVQSAVFDQEELFRFFREGPEDGVNPRHKLVALVGYYGLCRTAGFVFLDFADVKIEATQVSVTIGRTKSAAAAATTTFIIPNSEGLNVVELFNRYKNAQPKPQRGRFWHHWRNSRWTSLPVGQHPLAKTPKEVAAWLGKPNSNDFTGHCWRRTGGTELARAGASLEQLKRAGGWRSTTVAERYIADGEPEKKKQAQMMTPQSDHPERAPQPTPDTTAPTFTFQNCTGPIILNFGRS